jgi:hypothetical protein
MRLPHRRGRRGPRPPRLRDVFPDSPALLTTLDKASRAPLAPPVNDIRNAALRQASASAAPPVAALFADATINFSWKLALRVLCRNAAIANMPPSHPPNSALLHKSASETRHPPFDACILSYPNRPNAPTFTAPKYTTAPAPASRAAMLEDEALRVSGSYLYIWSYQTTQ